MDEVARRAGRAGGRRAAPDRAEKIALTEVRVEQYCADMQFVGQTHLLRVAAAPTATPSRDDLQRGVRGRLPRPLPRRPAGNPRQPREPQRLGHRRAPGLDLSRLIDPAAAPRRCRGPDRHPPRLVRRLARHAGLLARPPAAGRRHRRPAIIEQMDTTSSSSPATASADADGNLIVEVGMTSDLLPIPFPGGRPVPSGPAMIDPVTLAVIQAGLQQVCDEMDLTFSRAAFSPGDRRGRRPLGRHLCRHRRQPDRARVARACRSLSAPCSSPPATSSTASPRGVTAAPEPGDIYIVNDPYLGGTHLMDVRFAMPVWRDGAHLLLAVEHRPLARHRRRGAGRLLGQRHQRRAGRAAPAARSSCSSGA